MKKKIRGLLMLVIFCLLIILSVNGNVLAAETEEAVVVAEGTCGESLFWSLEEDGRLYIYGTGEMEDYEKPEEQPLAPCTLVAEENSENIEENDSLDYINKAPWGEYNEMITYVCIDEGVTSIGNYSFCNCYNLESVLFFPEHKNMKKIGEGAFWQCESLYRADLEELQALISIESSAFKYCASLKQITIPDTVTYIGEESFCGCASLQEIIIPDSVAAIGRYSLSECYNLKSVKFPEEIKTLPEGIFLECYSLSNIVIPESVEKIGHSAFAKCYALTDFTIPKSVKEIDSYAFSYCYTLTEIIMPESVETWGAGVFQNCTQLQSVTLPKNIKIIPGWMFSGCLSLHEIVFPESVEELGYNAFYDCEIQEILIPENVKAIKSKAFAKNIALREIVIPESVEELGDEVFLECSNLYKLQLEGNITSCGKRVFEYCQNLSEVSLENGITVIGDYMFYHCSGLREIILPDTVTVIGDYAFAYCTKLSDGSDVTGGGEYTQSQVNGATGLEKVILSQNLVEIEEHSFQGVFNLETITIPDGVKKIGNLAFNGCYQLKEIKLGSGVESIGEQAFWACEKLEEIILPKKVSTIEYGTFGGCKYLKKITLSPNVTMIEKNSFANCESLEEVSYGGTNAQWEKVSIAEEGNEDLLNALIICVDGPLGASMTLSEIEWRQGQYGVVAGIPLIEHSNLSVSFFVSKEFLKLYQELLVATESSDTSETYDFVGSVQIMDSNGNRVGAVSEVKIYSPGTGTECWIEGKVSLEQEVFLPRQIIKIQMQDMEQIPLAYGETGTFPYERFLFENIAKEVPEDLVENMFGESKAKNLRKYVEGGLGNHGTCFGMAVGTSLVDYGEIPASCFNDCIVLDQAKENTKLTGITNVENAEEYVMLCYLTQFTDSVQAALEASQNGYSFLHIQLAIEEYKAGKNAMPVIYIDGVKDTGKEICHAVCAYDYHVELGGGEFSNQDKEIINYIEKYRIHIYDNNYSDYRTRYLDIYKLEDGSLKYQIESMGIVNTLRNIDELTWFIPAASEASFVSQIKMAMKALLYLEDSIFPSFNGVKIQKIDWIAGAGEETAAEDDGNLTWVWGDGTVTVEKQTEDIMLADDYALYTVKSAEQTEFSLQNGNTAEAAVFGSGELCYSCEYSTEEGNVVVEFTGTSEEGVRMSYSGTNVKFSGIGEGTVTVSYENGSVWSKNIGTDGESEAVVNADGVNQPTDSEGKIWEDTKGEPVIPPKEEDEVVRISGKTRYETGYAVADALKEVLGAEKFEAVVVATGKNFADALAGSYLAVERHAPILLTNGKDDNVEELHAYIKANVAEGGKVYILGGDSAVPEAVDAIEGYEVERLFGDSRYDTNLEILKEAGVAGDSIIVATGKTFADSLSASAAKLPILLVKPDAALNDDQKAVLDGMKNIYIVGGEGAVSAVTQAELEVFGEVTRVFGESRYDTSVAAAKAFCTDVDKAVVASGKNFPDGLCGGPLAAALNAPLVLTKDGGASVAAAYVAENKIASGYVLGGDGALADDTVVDVFALESAEDIK